MTTITKFGFDVVHGCQLRCVGCPNSIIHPKIMFVSVDDFGKCLKNVNVSNVKYFRFFNFGDPMLHPLLLDLISILSKQPWISNSSTIEISTNAQFLNENTIKGIFEKGIITRIVVSCDGNGTPDDYEKIRVLAKWDKLMEFLSVVSGYKKLYNSKIQLESRTICVDADGRNKWNNLLNPLGFKVNFGEWSHMPTVKNPLFTGNVNVGMGACRYLMGNNLYVDFDGTVIPCCKHPKAFDLGNIKSSLYTDILKNKDHMRSKMKYNRANIPICNDCNM